MSIGRDVAAAPMQAHLLRASKFFGENEARNWSLFVFFRIMTPRELAATQKRLSAFFANGKSEIDRRVLRWEFATDMRTPALLNAQLDANAPQSGDEARSWREATLEEGQDAEDQAGAGKDFDAGFSTHPFRAWLDVLASADKSAFVGNLAAFIESQSAGDARRGANAARTVSLADPKRIIAAFSDGDPLSALAEVERLSSEELRALQAAAFAALSHPQGFKALLGAFGADPARAGATALKGGLGLTFLYEMLRQGAPAFADASKRGRVSAVRGEAQLAAPAAAPLFDPTPVNIAFTHSGLEALGVDKTTLRSFPEPFRQGMAARAARLGDVGQSAPAFWDGELGASSVHGYFTGGFHIGEGEGVSESDWKRLRREAGAFNAPADERGRALRLIIGAVARMVGLEILHIEIGQDPYELEGESDDPRQQIPRRLEVRREHFGFRDGLSQPFVDLKLGDVAPGGATPSRNSTWTPVAPGEIFLHERDEDGCFHELPINAKLRIGSTFLVFRKLEQDVAGFRNFLARQRPGDKAAQDALAAQIVGRWKNGAPLVLAPDFPRDYSGDAESVLNDFRYAADDPKGRKCPLGAHIRRTNPRDIGGGAAVRRTRILRRGISYGGPLLPETSTGDGERRGLLFVAANARIDLQFETMQAEWINKGEFLGQAGLGRCPLTGAHAGRTGDVFLEAGAAAPINEVPAFVHMRGGDYFFAPGVGALIGLAKGETFKPDGGVAPFDGHSMNDAVTPALFEFERLAKYTALIRAGTAGAVRVPLAEAPLLSLDVSPDCRDPKDPAPALPAQKLAPPAMVFVARYKHATRVLHGSAGDPKQLEFSVAHYRAAACAMTRGRNLLVGADRLGPTSDDRRRLLAVLTQAWERLEKTFGKSQLEERVAHVAGARIAAALRRTGPARRIDLVHDLAAEATYAVIEEVLGVRGPSWLSELGVSLPFSRQHIGELHPEWMAAASGRRPNNPGMASLQIWSVLVLADLIGNVKNIGDLKPLAQQAALEMLTHIDALIARARARPSAAPTTLLDAFVANEAWYQSQYPQCNYYSDVSILLFELAGTALAVTPLTFASVCSSVFDYRLDLPTLASIFERDPLYFEPTPSEPSYAGPSGWVRLIYEAERFTPNMPVRLRQCVRRTTLDGGVDIAPGEWVSVIMKAALFDDDGAGPAGGFESPPQFSLHPFLAGPPRDISKYLLFGVNGSQRSCWGRDRLALIVLTECLKGASRLEGLRRVAGPTGQVSKVMNVPVGFWARFMRVR